jgi:hypothetical protein
MTYYRQQGRVEYRSKDGKQAKSFEALEWLAAMCSHVPNRGEQMARYYGYYSNEKQRGHVFTLYNPTHTFGERF